VADKLSYVFEIDGKTHGFDVAVEKMTKADTVMGHLDRKTQILQAHLRQLKAPGEILRMEKEIANFGKLDNAVDKTKGRFHQFFSFLSAQVAFEAIKSLTHKVIELGKEALNAAGKAERMELSFELTLGQTAAEDILGWIEEIAGKTEFTDDKLKGWALDLANAGIKGEQLKDTMAAVLDVAGKRGAGAGDTAVDALSRATLTGKIEGRALRGLGIPIAELAQLDKFKGLTEKQIDKKLETATITKEDLLNLIAGPDKMLGDAGLKASKTFEARMMHLRDLPDQFFQKLSKTEAFGKLSSALARVLEKLDPDSPTGKKIASFLTDVFGKAAESIEKIDLAGKIELFTEAMRGFADIAGPILKFAFHELEGIAFLIGRITGHTKSTAAQKKDIKGEGELEVLHGKFQTQRRFMFMNPAEATGPKELETIKELNAKIEAEQRAELERVKGVFSDPMAFETAIIAMKQAGKDMSVGMAQGLKEGVPEVAREARNVVKKGAIDPARDEAGAHSPATKFIDLGLDIGDGFIVGMQRKQREVDEMMRGAFAPPAAPPGRAGASVSLSIPVQITVGSTGDAKADGDAAGGAFVEAVRGPILELLEEFGLEGGR
jgi:hypothetical protein